ncbi:MAG: flagellar hook-associated protein FlgK [Gammaproteobacteria bacterium]|nr:flagellar hook-associated protein FlgK [Gammaproteobacteria bacterium]|tara:strand:+ start:5555 stop:8209 length:2655 start_codon:yes stop_codon:yes gene_type:complete
MSALLNTAITGIRLNQTAMSVTGHNIVNANTEGYTRQSVIQSTNPSTATAAGYLGTGVNIDEIIRHTEKYLVDQVVRDIGVLSEADSYLVNVSQVNNLLAADQTNLANYMNQFFDSVNQSVNDPGSMLGRELLMTQSQQMVAGFKSIEARLLAQNSAVNKQLQGAADNITSLGQQIAAMNKAIGDAGAGNGSPNDLLDKLDVLVKQLGRYVDVSTVARDNGAQDVFIGQGQPLVVGDSSQTIKAVPGVTDASRFDLVIVNRSETKTINQLMTGGEVGGLLRFRQDALQPAIGAVGLLATSITASVNAQNALGMNLEGSLGGNVFKDVNDPVIAANRVKSSLNNRPPNDRELNVTIESLADLQISDYELKFEGPGRKYTLVRMADNTVVADGLLSEAMPQSVKVDGFSINFEGGSFQGGDRFLLKPTSTGATDMAVQITRAEEFAFASPIRVQAGSANLGGARVLSSQVLSVDTPLFTKDRQLSPPLMIRFTSATTYDVLDYSDPANPKQTNPPMRNLSFVPGSTNSLLPTDPGGLTLTTSGAASGALQIGQATNGHPGEELRFQTTDPETGFIRYQTLNVVADESAANMARRLSGLVGVQATAYTETVLSGFDGGVPGNNLGLQLNGKTIAESDWFSSTDFAGNVPDYLRDQINNNAELTAQGIRARSDGAKLTVYATSGVDLNFSLTGSGSLTVDQGASPAQVVDASDPAPQFTVGGKLQMQVAANTQAFSNRNDGILGSSPELLNNFTGINVVMSSGSGADASPRAGDSFVIGFNTNGSADNRNGLAMLALNSTAMLGGENQTYQDVYGQLAEKVGIMTSQARVNQSAGESMLRQSMDALQSVAGVNLEEEAARLIQLEQHYNASARLITLARDLFETLLGI